MITRVLDGNSKAIFIFLHTLGPVIRTALPRHLVNGHKLCYTASTSKLHLNIACLLSDNHIQLIQRLTLYIALRKAKIVCNFGLFKCNRVKY